MEMLMELPQEAQAFIVVSPFLLLFILLALILKRGLKKLEKTTGYWLILTIFFTIVYWYYLTQGESSWWEGVRGALVVISSGETYLLMKKNK